VHASFPAAGLVARVAVYVAPLVVGGRQAAPVVGGGRRELKSAVELGSLTATPVGDDLLIEADVVREGREALCSPGSWKRSDRSGRSSETGASRRCRSAPRRRSRGSRSAAASRSM